MKRLRPQRWPAQVLRARCSGARPTPHSEPNGPQCDQHIHLILSPRLSRSIISQQIRRQSNLASNTPGAESEQLPPVPPQPAATGYSALYPPPPTLTSKPLTGAYLPPAHLYTLPSPPPSRALSSAKLAALHSRLALPPSVPLQTLARCLVHPSADGNASFNNALLALPGRAMLGYLVSEWLLARYPRLPMAVLTGAVRAFAGRTALEDVVERQWGVEAAAEPGGEVDPGLLQFRARLPGSEAESAAEEEGGEAEAAGDGEGAVEAPSSPPATIRAAATTTTAAPRLPQLWPPPLPAHETAYAPARQRAYASVLHAVVGALLAHESRQSARSFVRAHVLSRHLDVASLFHVSRPTRELSLLCRREGFEPPVARLLSETGRLSRTPVFVVGIFSGRDKLAEGVGSSLDAARAKAAANALRAWYLYSPGARVVVPSETWPVPGEEDWEVERRGRAWSPLYVDVGEVVSN